MRSHVKEKRGCWQARRLEIVNAPLAASETAAPRFRRRMEPRTAHHFEKLIAGLSARSAASSGASMIPCGHRWVEQTSEHEDGRREV